MHCKLLKSYKHNVINMAPTLQGVTFKVQMLSDETNPNETNTYKLLY